MFYFQGFRAKMTLEGSALPYMHDLSFPMQTLAISAI